MPKISVASRSQDTVTIVIDQTKFLASRSALCESSTFFADHFSEGSQANSVGYCYAFGQVDVFPHILNYCHTLVFPLLYSAETGKIDHAAYYKLFVESKRYGIQNLTDWIKDQKYTEAINVKTCIGFYTQDELVNLELETKANEEVKITKFENKDDIFPDNETIYKVERKKVMVDFEVLMDRRGQENDT